ncbi:MAG TPA: VWA domain-containing protein [Fontimonas sp.]
MKQQKLLLMSGVAMLVVACAQTAVQPPASKEKDEQVDLGAASTAVIPAPEPGIVDVAEPVRADAAQAGAVVEQRGRTESAKLMRQSLQSAPMAAYMGAPQMPMPQVEQNRENYAHFDDNGLLRAAEQPVSTFSIDVDTGAYSNVRRLLRAGQLPPEDAVRVEELINYFDYAYAPPARIGTPFSTQVEIAPTPWNPRTQLMRIGLQGWKPAGELPPSNLVFLLDVSGSMNDPDKLPLVQSALKLLVNEMTARDRISLVVYAGASGVVLEPTPADQTAKISAAIDRLSAGGSTNGGAGIDLAYKMAQQGYIKGGINRVLLATDGDFNVGTVSFEQLKDMVEQRRKTGIALSTLGFGSGNYNDHLMEQLADAGNGNYSYIDSLAEAQRALVHSRAATLQTIAKDVKIQVEFNPELVAEYRLIGYENRALKREDFNNDKIDAGEIGAGHNVTALYEIALVGSAGVRNDPLRYEAAVRNQPKASELAFLRLRYKAPDGDTSQLIERPILRSEIQSSLAAASADYRFAAAVAGFGQLLRGGRYTEHFGYAEVAELARAARGSDDQGWRGEFVQLVDLARALSATQSGSAEPVIEPQGSAHRCGAGAAGGQGVERCG